MRLLFIAACAAALVGCATNPSVVQISPDTFLIAKQDKSGMFGNSAAFKAEVIQEANAFAQARGKVAIPVNLKQSPMWPGHFASVEYQFRVVDPNDPEAKRTALTPRADVVIENKQTSTVDLNVKETPKQQDSYTELLKLDDLRKRGIISEAEFERRKRTPQPIATRLPHTSSIPPLAIEALGRSLRAKKDP